LAKHNLENPEFDFTKLVFGYGVADSGRFLPMRGDYNLGEARKERLSLLGKASNFEGIRARLIVDESRNNQYSVVTSNSLRGKLFSALFLKTKSSRLTSQKNNVSDYQFAYDNENKISNVLVNKLEIPFVEQGFQYNYDNEYFHLYLLDTEGQDDLKNPEFVLQALDDFVEIINRKNVDSDPRTYIKLEYQIVSDQIIGMDEGYLIYDFGFGDRINKNKYEAAGLVETGFVNVSN
jgi:hypothetical protein